ncbi:protein-glutamate O-methyltransferase CheR [Motiliproteus sp. MSK22-1]|uniref:CheR family methyltransferase n=1 Tax=Motiliproteus sp. MSK22-1 TaxID=1897630 RepID=UPI000978177E|nr:protein-glutamate O-methyltransferase CheR [Motiliproteus sp. MSK22-1]OMH32212.1 chemotaxis protein CheR [Motiliproteus sp. MSK22-1]
MAEIIKASASDKQREFGFTAEDFESVRQRLNDHAGIVLSDIKRDMVYNRLTRRLRVLGLSRIEQYLQLLDNPDRGPEEFVNFINALTTNLTSFFREPHHFEYLRQQLPSLLKRTNTLKIWSAGCSIGEEPYTIAITLSPLLHKGQSAQILATDIDTSVLAAADKGIYDQERVQKLDQTILKQAFLRGKGQRSNMVRIKPELRSMVQFTPLNLMGPWPMKGPFDIIFCRNVMIYFNKETQKKLVNRMADLLIPQGHLFIGHSETLHNTTDRFQAVGQTIYRLKH